MISSLLAVLLQATAPAAGVEPPPSPDARASKPASPLKLVSPNWLQRPTAEQFGLYYPIEAARQYVAGKAVVRCTVQPDGKLSDCSLDREDPEGFGFGRAALDLTIFFAADRVDAEGKPTSGFTAQVPVRFLMPGNFEATPKRIRDPSFTEARVDLDCRFKGPQLDNCIALKVEPAGSPMEAVAYDIVARMDMAPQRQRVGRITIPLLFTSQALPAK